MSNFFLGRRRLLGRRTAHPVMLSPVGQQVLPRGDASKIKHLAIFCDSEKPKHPK